MTPHEGLGIEYLARTTGCAALPRKRLRRVCILAHGGFA
jgi:hypothetical protein